MGVKSAFRHLSLSIACTRKPLKNNDWCNAVFWPPTPKQSFLTVLLTVKVFQRFQRQEIPSIDAQDSEIRCK